MLCYPRVCHVEYAPRARLRLGKKTPRALLRSVKKMGQTHGRTDDRLMHYAYRYRDATNVSYRIVLFLVFPTFFVSVPCARLSWPHRQLLSSRKYIVSYRIVHKSSKTPTRQNYWAALKAATLQQIGVGSFLVRSVHPREIVWVDSNVRNGN